MQTIGSITYTRTSEFQHACFLEWSGEAYEVLDKLLPENWYPENTDTAWTDVAAIDSKYYAVYGEDSVMTSDAQCIYIEIKPTSGMKSDYEYFKQY